MNDQELLEQAKKVLLANRRKDYTLPSAQIYPFQWKWDSGFCALGYAYFDINKAMKEMETLFMGQWSNGFVPHIIYHPSVENISYFPNADFFHASLSDYANPLYETTTITQPPIEGWVLERIFLLGHALPEVTDFVKRLFPKALAQHEYLYNNRDPHNEGLVYIQHNWESGTDNSPVWDEIWKSFEAPSYHFTRKDTTFVQEEQRPHQREYDYYLYLIDLFKELKYVDREIAEKSPFLVQDPLFNSMLVASNNSLIRLAKFAGYPEEVDRIKKWNKKSITSFNEKLYDEEAGVYKHYDLRKNKWLDGITSSGLAPLFAGIPSPERAKKMLNVLRQFSKGGKYYLCTSFNPDDKNFEPQRYWRGPVWINMNWLIYNGLMRFRLFECAEKVKEDTLQVVREQGFYEYFEPDKGKSKHLSSGYGGKDFSWTASLIIDLLYNKS